MENVKWSVLNACRHLLKPIVRLLLKSGISWQEFAEISKQVYVDVALLDYGIKGRPTNLSRVAILTGINRKEAKRYRDNTAEIPLPKKTSEAVQVLDGWHYDAAYTDEQGKPRLLCDDERMRESDPSFADQPLFSNLHKTYGGDLPFSALLKELLNTGTIARVDDGRLKVVKRFYMPQHLDEEAIIRTGEVMQDMGNTVVHNLVREGTTPSKFEGRATQRIPKSQLKAFSQFMEDEGMAFLERADDWLDRHQASTEEDVVWLGTGVYLIERDINKEQTA